MDPQHLRPGYWLDRYELLCPLAYGGMASVWLARFGGRAGFERLVVVKMILPQYSQDPRFQEMFLDEARIASRIEHANVARILDVGEHASGHFIVMQWVDGDSLSKLMRAADKNNERISPGVALRICSDAAAGLHAAHVLEDRDGTPLGVVHRDVSPQNILVANTGATMLIDFGIAKARDRVSQDTSAGQLKGKVRYMAPEQAIGRAVDRRADIWSLGTILYELFAGHPAYDGDNEVATLHKLTSGEPPPPLPDSVPEPVREIIARALAHDVEGRFETAMDLHLALESAMAKIGEPTSTANVASFAKQLLAERQELRRRTVDEALSEARARDAVRAQSGMTNPGMTNPGMTNPGAAMPIPPYAFSTGVHPFGQTDPSGMVGTLGSAVVDYPAQTMVPISTAPRGRRTAFMALGFCLLAALVGVILIVATTQARLNAFRTVDERAAQAEREREEARAKAPRAASPAPEPTQVPTATVATTSATPVETDAGVTSAQEASSAGSATTDHTSTAASSATASGTTRPTTTATGTSSSGSSASSGTTGTRPKSSTPTTGGKKKRDW